jgi:predicted RNA-binding protein
MVSDKEPEQGQSREAIALARGVREKAVAAEPAITKLVQAVADQSGAKLEGLSQRIKSTDSLSRKIDQDAEKQYRGDRNKAAEEISDANRYTISVNDNDYADTLKSTVSAFEETGWKVRVKNFWQAGDPYDGVNVKAERDGIKVEVQVHTPKSYEIKEKALHDVYEVYRKSTDDSVRESTWNKMIGIAKRVPRPSNYATVLGVGTLILQQFETAQQAGLIKSTPVGKLSHERRA